MKAKPVFGKVSKQSDMVGRRDAFHVPCVLVRSHHTIYGGESVRFVGGDLSLVEKCGVAQRHGVLDPFILCISDTGGMAWMMLDPKMVKDLTHNFDIEGFNLEATKDEEIEDLKRQITGLEEEIDDFPEPDECAGCYD